MLPRINPETMMPAPELESFARTRGQLLRLPLFMLAALYAAVGCSHAPLQKTSIYIGNGMQQGDPPICFQYRSEARPTPSSTNNIWVHLNNTCSYPIQCDVYDSVTEQEHPVSMPPFKQGSFVVAINAPTDRVSLKLTCTWKA
jgi:hypothetical protein